MLGKVKKDGNNIFDLTWVLSFGVAIITFGFSVSSDRLYFTYVDGIVDLGKYYGIIGAGLIAFGIIYLFLALKGFLSEEGGDVFYNKP